MKKSILIIVSIIVAQLSFSQDSTKFEVLLRINPQAIIDPYTATIQSGIELRFNKKIALEFDYGHQFNKFELWKSEDRYAKKQSYYKLKFGVKYYPLNLNLYKNIDMLPYIGLAYFYIPNYYIVTDAWFTDSDGSQYTFDAVDIFKETNIATLKLGVEYVIFKRLNIDFSGEIGLRNARLSHLSYVNKVETDEFYWTEWGFFGPNNRHPMVRNSLYLGVNLKIGFIPFKIKSPPQTSQREGLG